MTPKSFRPSRRVHELRARLDHPIVDGDGHLLESVPLFFDFLGRWMNRDFWDGLPPDLQTVVDNASAKAVAFQRGLASQENADALQAMIEGGAKFNRVSEAELARFREVTAPVYAKYEPEFGKELIESIRGE